MESRQSASRGVGRDWLLLQDIPNDAFSKTTVVVAWVNQIPNEPASIFG